MNAEGYARHGWIITDDYLYDGPDDPIGCGVGAVGPDNIDPRIRARLQAGHGRVWRVWDDDGVCYFRGTIIVPDDATDAECMSPLREYAVGLGAVRLRWSDRHGVHEFEV